MQSLKCPYCFSSQLSSEGRRSIISAGRFYRKSDQKTVRRYFCKTCDRGFSLATGDPCYWQRKRHLNAPIASLLASGVSQRRLALLFQVNRKTIARKLVFLGGEALFHLQRCNLQYPKSQTIQFDDMETFEHTKCKPLSITLAVEEKTRRILGFQVSKMPAKGLLAKISVKKYGYRKDERPLAREILFTQIKPLVLEDMLIKSDQNPHYPPDVKRHFPKAEHQTFKGRRGCVVGQGELKKIGFDPIFSLNHTCAKLRGDINRLFRRTWCTTKRPDRLAHHLAIVALIHNQRLPTAQV